MISILYTFLSLNFLLQSPSVDCKEEVSKAYTQLKKLYGAQQQGLYMKYTVTATDWKKGTNQETVLMYAGIDRTKVVSNTTVIFQDDQALVTIDKGMKRVLISNPPSADWKTKRFENFSMYFDTLYNKLKVVSCDNECQDERTKNRYRKIAMVLPKTQSVKNSLRVTYWLDENKPEIKGIDVFYDSNSPVQEVNFRIEEMRESYTEKPFLGKAVDQALTRSGKLVDRFKGFQLIDVRKKNN